MAPANVDATVILLDVGRNVAQDEEGGKTFFQNARDCVSRILERKIMSRPKDLISIILMGSKHTKNRLSSLAERTDVFRHILYLTKNENEDTVAFVNPTWDILKKLPEKATKYDADWFDGLLVAADALQNGLYGGKISNKKIVIVSNFQAPSNLSDNVDKVVAGFQHEEFEVNIITQSLDLEKTVDKDALSVINSFISGTDGVVMTFDQAMRYLLFHRKRATKPMPWNVDLTMGPNVKIPISAYGRIRDDKVIRTWQKAYKDPITETASTTEGIGRKKEFFRSEDNAPVADGQVISGYLYGQKVVPFSDTDKSMLYDSGPRGLQIYGFTERDNIKWQHLAGNGTTYVFGRKGDPNAQKALVSLVTALNELQMVAVARRVYNNGNAPMMHALFPCIDQEDNFFCLSAIGLCFAEDIKYLSFPSTNLKKYEPSKEEIEGFTKLIDSMNLMEAYDETYDCQEAFPVTETVNPSVQYMMDCLAFRAVNPGKPLPLPRDDIMTLFKPPEFVEKRSKDTIEELKKLLNLKEVQKKPSNRRFNRNPPATSTSTSAVVTDAKPDPTTSAFANIIISPSNDDDAITDIGTVDPVGDFRTLKNAGKPLEALADELAAVIENLVYLNFDDNYTKAMDTIKVFREESVKENPNKYNDWLKDFKTALVQRGKGNVLDILRTENLNLIVKEENNLSSVTKEELEDDNPMYDADTVPNSTQLTVQSDIYAMFDEM